METVRELLDKKGRKVWSIKPDAPVFEAIKLLDRHGIGALVVLEGDKLSGIVSIGDVARATIAKDDFLIGQLTNYISGG